LELIIKVFYFNVLICSTKQRVRSAIFDSNGLHADEIAGSNLALH
jgi:hypothetical protein